MNRIFDICYESFIYFLFIDCLLMYVFFFFILVLVDKNEYDFVWNYGFDISMLEVNFVVVFVV